MKPTVLLGLLLSLASAVAQQPDPSVADGVIYGTVIGSDGSPAKGVLLNALPVGVPLATRLPATQTDQNGNYRFERLPWWGRYTVYADDAEAGYSLFSTGPGPAKPPEASISPDHAEARLDLRLPPKAGFLRIHLTNQRTGAVISGLEFRVTSNEAPPRLIYMGSSFSDRAVLLPPDKDLLIHITSDGFHEWGESAGKGKAIRMAPGSQVELDVELAPE